MSLSWTYSCPIDESQVVTVTFNTGEWLYICDVDAVFTSNGEYDEESTEARIEEIALSVENNIELGAIEYVENPAYSVANTP